MNDQYLYSFSNITTEEMMFIKEITQNLDPETKNRFMLIYGGKRRDPQHILITGLLGFVGVAGVQRFLTNQIAMGIIYFFTAGFCFIGTIIDLVNYKNLANEFNHKMALESRSFIELARH
ncbi:TM2 domain-containing protein [Pedobacter sp. SD-b]|uniref:TM2 domain-containing protein n=1 Tax=Pedobacter segetis TaxID=2793069 RepID=A0ABS1BH70_9SPHI|nr:TM2 domain-containing protein [Pedobacter segetis]MBK0382220.1 TM2 domain-containing protein [Pedobacter segetis]